MQIDFLTVLNCCSAKNCCTSGKMICVFVCIHILSCFIIDFLHVCGGSVDFMVLRFRDMGYNAA